MKITTIASIFVVLIGSTLGYTESIYAEDQQQSSLSVGLNYSMGIQPYQGKRTYQSVLPTAFFDNDKVYLEGDEAGVYLLNDDKNELRLNAYYDGSSYDPSGKFNGLDRRKWSVMAGGSYMRTTPYGGFKAQISTDTLSRSHGTVATASYLAEFKHDKWSFYPEVGLQWNDAKYNQYYYGISDVEAQRTGLNSYKSKQSFNPYASLAVNYDMTKHWSIFGTFQVDYLSKEQADSPFVTRRTDFNPSIGIKYKF